MKSLKNVIKEDFKLRAKGKINKCKDIYDEEYLILLVKDEDWKNYEDDIRAEILGGFDIRDNDNEIWDEYFIMSPKDAINWFKKCTDKKTKLFMPINNMSLYELLKLIEKGKGYLICDNDFSLIDFNDLKEIDKNDIA